MFQMVNRPFTVSFFGHRYVEDFSGVERTVERILSELFQRNEMIELLVGKDGEFDQIVSSSIKRAKRQYGDYYCSHVWVLPYPTAELRDKFVVCIVKVRDKEKDGKLYENYDLTYIIKPPMQKQTA